MTPQKFEALKDNIITQLKSHLLPGLYYHSPEHTLDVLNAAERIGQAEKITDAEMLLLKTAALLHDSGYLFTAKNHEENSCRIARLVLTQNDFTNEEIDIICDLIMATKVPHQPQNKLAEILCDADLDYLGRKDFSDLSQKLFDEMSMFAKVKDKDEWNKMQISFFEQHTYYTETSRKLRDSLKEKHLQDIRLLLISNKRIV